MCSALASGLLGTRPAGLRRARIALGGSGAVTIMSTAMNFGTKSFQPRPPDKGSFPLDHFGERRAAREREGCPVGESRETSRT